MPKIHISQPHSLPVEDVITRFTQYLDKLRDDKLKAMSFDYKWNPDKSGVSITGKGFSGDAKVNASQVDVNLELSMLLSPFKGQVEEQLKRGLVKSLTPST